MNELGFKKLNEQTLSNVDGGRNTWQQNVGGAWGALGGGVIGGAVGGYFGYNS